jgi:hypothetical protein
MVSSLHALRKVVRTDGDAMSDMRQSGVQLGASPQPQQPLSMRQRQEVQALLPETKKEDRVVSKKTQKTVMINPHLSELTKTFDLRFGMTFTRQTTAGLLMFFNSSQRERQKFMELAYHLENLDYDAFLKLVARDPEFTDDPEFGRFLRAIQVKARSHS